MTLSPYEQLGFRFFLCHSDKSPESRDWQNPDNHLTLEQAEAFQAQGKYIGAWIPDDMVVLNINTSGGEKVGLESFIQIKKEFGITLYFDEDTFCVRTYSGGYHVFFKVPEDADFGSGVKAPGVELKTHDGYVIANGSPGYYSHCDAEPMMIPTGIKKWLRSVDEDAEGKHEIELLPEERKLPLPLLKRVLNKINPENYRESKKWINFIAACFAATDGGDKVTKALQTWSDSDEEMKGKRSVADCAGEIATQHSGVTIGSFIMHMQDENLSAYMIKEVVKYDSLNKTLSEAEAREYHIPFQEPDYRSLSCLPEAEEFFNFQGNTAAASILTESLSGKVIFVEGEDKRFYYFDGSKWDRLTDIHGVVYTVLYRIMKFKYASKGDDSEASNLFIRVILALANTGWKANTIREFSGREGIFHELIHWDSPAIKETVTTKDGVIDFRGGGIRARDGLPTEFRRSFVPYTSQEILKAGEPERYLEFLHEIFPDEATFETARFSSSTFISGNANRRTFHIWVGEGSNGKSTWIDMLQKSIGDKAITYDVKLLLPEKFTQMGATPEMAKFEGAHVAFGIEIDSGKRFSSGMIKKLTGGDTLAVRPLYRASIDLEATWQLVFCCNDLPSFNANDPAFINRLLILPFDMRYYKNEDDRAEARRKGTPEDHIVKAADKNSIIDSTMAERAGIIRMMIQDYVKLGSEFGGVIPESPECKKHKRAYITENDILGEFLREHCEIDATGQAGYFVKSSAITEVYQNYTGFKRASNTAVTRDIIKYDKRVERGVLAGCRGLKNIKLKLDAPGEQKGMDFGSGTKSDGGDEDYRPFG